MDMSSCLVEMELSQYIDHELVDINDMQVYIIPVLAGQLMMHAGHAKHELCSCGLLFMLDLDEDYCHYA